MNQPTPSTEKKLGRAKITALIAGAVLILYAICGFLIVPAVLQTKLPEMIATQLGRKATIGDIDLNPFTLVLTVSAFTLQEPDGAPFAGFEELSVNFQLSSALRRAFTFKEIRLLAPKGVLVLLPDGRLNISDLISATDGEEPPQEPHQSEEPAGLPRLVIASLDLIGGSFTLRNQSQGAAVVRSVSEIDFKVTNFSTVSADTSGFTITASGNAGGRLQLDGRLTAEPPMFDGSLEISDFPLNDWWRFLDRQLPFNIADGRLALSAYFALSAGEDDFQANITKGVVTLSDGKVDTADGNVDLLTIPAFSLTGIDMRLTEREITIAEVASNRAHFNIWRTPQGKLNYLELLAGVSGDGEGGTLEPPAPGGSAEPSDKPWHLTVGKIRLEEYGIDFEDRSFAQPITVGLRPIDVYVEQVDTAPGTMATYTFSALTDANEHLQSEGAFGLMPVTAKGSFDLKNLRLRRMWEVIEEDVRFEISAGTLSLAGGYGVSLAGDEPEIDISDLGVSMVDFHLGAKGADESIITIPEFSLQGIAANTHKRQASITSVQTSGGRIEGRLTPEGQFHLAALLLPSADPAQGNASLSGDTATTSPSQSWEMTIAEVAVADYGLVFEDQTLPKAGRFVMEPVALTARKISTGKEAQPEFALSIGLGGGGTIAAEGKASLEPLALELDLKFDQIALKTFQPYVDASANLDVVDGKLNQFGHLALQKAQDGEMKIIYSGSLSIDNFVGADRRNAEEFIRWESFGADKLKFENRPNRITSDLIYLKGQHSTIAIDPKGEVNAVEAFSSPEEKGPSQEEVPSLPMRIAKFLATHVEGDFSVDINRVRISDAQADFTDGSIAPPFSDNLLLKDGTFNNISTTHGERAEVDIHGVLGKYAPLKLSGIITPLSEEDYGDISLSLKNFGLAPTTPYASKYIGYAIDEGKLSLDLHYSLEEERFKGENKIVLDRLTLGEEVESPDAVDLPIGLAVALLKDRNDRITINLPIEGHTDDPQFNFGGLIAGSIIKLITGVVTSPFAIVGALTGGDSKKEDLSWVAFEFGKAALSHDQGEKLDKIAKALLERPVLSLKIRGEADPVKDRAGLAQGELLLRMQELRYEELKRAGGRLPDRVEEIRLSEKEEIRLIQKLYRDRFGENLPKPAPQKPASGDPTTEFEAARTRLLESMEVDDAALLSLADNRADNIKARLVAQKLSAERININISQIHASTSEIDVRVQMSLAGE